MSTGTEFAAITSKKLLGFVDFDTYLLRYMQSSIQGATKRLFIQGSFEERMPLSSSGANQLQVDLKPVLSDGFAHDGAGHLLDLEQVDRTAVFENVSGQTYEVGARYIEVPRGIRINPRTGKPEYDRFVEGIGVEAEPDDVFIGVSTITFGIDLLFEQGVGAGNHTGRIVRVFRTVPGDVGTTEAVAIEECTVYYDGENKIDTVGFLGQTVPEMSLSFYRVQLIGLTVLRDTADNRPSQLPDEVFFIGTVVGNGGTPSAFDVSGQNVIQSQSADAIAVEALPNWADGTTNPADDLQAVLARFVTDLTSTSGGRGAAKLTAAALANWADGTTNPAATLGAALAKFVTDLTSTTGGRGAAKLTAPALTNWLDGTTNPATTVDAALAKIITDLKSTAGGRGAAKITAPVLSGAPYAIPATSLSASLFFILEALNTDYSFRALDALLDLQLVDTGVSESLRAVDVFGGVVVMVGDNGTILTSDDGGFKWTARTPGSAFSGVFYGVKYFVNIGTWIAVGESGEIQTSPDGITWTRRNTGGNDLFAVALDVAGAKLIAIGEGRCLVSSDFISWVAGGALPGGGAGYNQIVFSVLASRFVATGHTGNVATSVAYSTNGSVWTAVNVGIETVYNLVDGGDLGVVVEGVDAGGNHLVAHSANAISYTVAALSQLGLFAFSSVVVMDTGFAVLSQHVANSIVYTSADGVTWTALALLFVALPQSTKLQVLRDVFYDFFGSVFAGPRIALAPALNASGVRGYYRSRQWTRPFFSP